MSGLCGHDRISLFCYELNKIYLACSITESDIVVFLLKLFISGLFLKKLISCLWKPEHPIFCGFNLVHKVFG